jgi:hypothetical protein
LKAGEGFVGMATEAAVEEAAEVRGGDGQCATDIGEAGVFVEVVTEPFHGLADEAVAVEPFGGGGAGGGFPGGAHGEEGQFEKGVFVAEEGVNGGPGEVAGGPFGERAEPEDVGPAEGNFEISLGGKAIGNRRGHGEIVENGDLGGRPFWAGPSVGEAGRKDPERGRAGGGGGVVQKWCDGSGENGLEFPGVAAGDFEWGTTVEPGAASEINEHGLSQS